MRLKRKRLLWRAFRARRRLTCKLDRTQRIGPDDPVVVCVLRNEASRLPYFLDYYRSLGIRHFLMVDNQSTDGSDAFLAAQPDVSFWQTPDSYREARFGLDWAMWLLRRYGHNRWCLIADVDELLVYDQMHRCDLPGLTRWLDQRGRAAFGALMLDIYPKGRLSTHQYDPGQDPTEVLQWFDAAAYRSQRQAPLGNLWVQGGARERVFFANNPLRSPTLNKLPLVKWQRSYACVNSCHSMLPRQLNAQYDGPGGAEPSGVLLHTKFLPEIVSKSEIEKHRRQHFNQPADFDNYYSQIVADPDLWHPSALYYAGAEQLVQLGLMTSITL